MPSPIDKKGWDSVIRDSVKARLSQKVMAAMLKCSPGCVAMYMRERGIKPARVEIMRTLRDRRAKSLEPRMRELAEVKRLGAEDIGPMLGISPSSARKYMKHLGIDFPTNGRTVFRYDTTGWEKDVLRWHRQGKSLPEIAKLKGVSVSTIYRWLANNGHITVRERDTHA